MKRSGTNSIILLALRTFPNLRLSWVNLLIPWVCGIVSGAVVWNVYHPGSGFVASTVQLLNVLLSFNGAILGLVMAGFAIYAALPHEQITVFTASQAPEGGKYSFLKYRLLYFFKTFFWVFLGCCAITAMYAVYTLVSFAVVDISVGCRKLLAATTWALIAVVQAKIFVELKIFIFTIYTNTLTLARFVCQQAKQEPFDKSSD